MALLTGSQGRAQRRQALLDIASGQAGIVIGTHALLEEHVSFADLGLVVVDEQHRFGVEQRAALTDKAGSPPHLLVMTATPIPRTVAMTVFGDLEISTLTELPAGRAPIQTTVVPAAGAARLDRAGLGAGARGGRARAARCTSCARGSPGTSSSRGRRDAVDVDDEGDVAAAPAGSLAAVEDVLAELTAGPLAGLRVAPLHGRLPRRREGRRDATPSPPARSTCSSPPP